ncbi:NAD(P)H-dependent oxidoreductase subunit E [Candidatus Woesearchaeota archaeon]|nr:NAD(P)H-dependent oxidoreductase subunit E [Candidatus Woesearchaeota archaeon]
MDKILINVLKEVQDNDGYISEKAMKNISVKYNVPLAKLYGVATFYAMFKIEKQGEHIIEICGSPSCMLNNGQKIEDFLEKELKIEVGKTTKNKKFSLYKTSCIGCCDEAPAMLMDGKPYTNLTIEKIKKILKKY